jgi:hypothetical protein
MEIKINNKILEHNSINDLSYLVASEVSNLLNPELALNETEVLALKSILQTLKSRSDYYLSLNNQDDYEFYCDYRFVLIQNQNGDRLIDSESVDLFIRGINEPKLFVSITCVKMHELLKNKRYNFECERYLD